MQQYLSGSKHSARIAAGYSVQEIRLASTGAIQNSKGQSVYPFLQVSLVYRHLGAGNLRAMVTCELRTE
jgi:hypothetical protein